MDLERRYPRRRRGRTERVRISDGEPVQPFGNNEKMLAVPGGDSRTVRVRSLDIDNMWSCSRSRPRCRSYTPRRDILNIVGTSRGRG